MYKGWQQQKVAVTIEESSFKQRCAEKSSLEAGSRNAKIIDKYRLKFTAKVSRKGSEKR